MLPLLEILGHQLGASGFTVQVPGLSGRQVDAVMMAEGGQVLSGANKPWASPQPPWWCFWGFIRIFQEEVRLNWDSKENNVRVYHFIIFLFLFLFLGLHLWHMEVPRLGVQSELQLPAYTTATTMRDPSHICDLHHSSQPRWMPHPLSEARDQTCIFVDTSWICFCWAATGPLSLSLFLSKIQTGNVKMWLQLKRSFTDTYGNVQVLCQILHLEQV